MSDCVIRFGGGYCSSNPFIKELSEYIKKCKGRSFVVVSSVKEIKELISESIDGIFREGVNEEEIRSELKKIFFELTGNIASSIYLSSVEKLVQLLLGIQLIGDYSDTLKGQVLSFSEKLSAQILAHQFQKFTDAQIIYPEEVGLEVTEDYGNATYTNFKADNLDRNGVFLIPGSYGITPGGKIARAGVAASDYTAAAIAAFVNASELVLWGMEKDFFSIDPQLVENPNKIDRLTYSEASELAYFDHYSIHPRIVEPLAEKHVPIHVVSAITNKVETVINTESFVAEGIVKSVSYSDDISILKLNGPGVGLKPGILAKVTNCLNDAGINIKSVITAQVSINFLLDKANGIKALDLIKSLGFESVNETLLEEDVSLIGIIGHGLLQSYGVAAKLFTAVAENKVNTLLSGSGSADLVSYIVVKKEDRNTCVKAIYKAFFEN